MPYTYETPPTKNPATSPPRLRAAAVRPPMHTPVPENIAVRLFFTPDTSPDGGEGLPLQPVLPQFPDLLPFSLAPLHSAGLLHGAPPAFRTVPQGDTASGEPLQQATPKSG